MIKKSLVTLLGCLACNTVYADLWQDTSINTINQQRGSAALIAKQNQVKRFTEARLLDLDMAQLRQYLDSAPAEDSSGLKVSMQLPLPNGRFDDYLIYDSPVMAPELAAKYPDIRTFRAISRSNPANTGRLDLTPQGFHAILVQDGKTVFIDPIGDSNHYQSYFKHDYVARQVSSGQQKSFVCHNGTHNSANVVQRSLSTMLLNPAATIIPRPRFSFGSQIKTYRLAMAATGEFTSFHGGTKASGLAALVTGINRVNQVYEVDLATKLELIANNDDIVYTNAASDPFGDSADWRWLMKRMA